MLKIKLTKDLRKNIKRGNPWIFKNAIDKNNLNTVSLCKVYDNKNEFLAWGYVDPDSQIAVRILSLDEIPPNENYYKKQFENAYSLRKQAIDTSVTNCFRLFNGEGDQLPGMICDIYNKVAVLQFDGRGAAEFWKQDFLIQWLHNHAGVSTVLEKNREISEDSKFHILFGDPIQSDIEIIENNFRFEINLQKGQKTGFFLDQRENRNYVKTITKDLTVLNLFSYTGGFSVYAGKGGAAQVTSVDISKGAIEQSIRNWQLNGLNINKHNSVAKDVLEFLKFEEDKKWDLIIVDPPSMVRSETHREKGEYKYIELFVAAGRHLARNGHLILSSCSSHISFNDFNEIINSTLSKLNRRGQIIHVSGQGVDHPFPQAFQEFRYLKFVHLKLY